LAKTPSRLDILPEGERTNSAILIEAEHSNILFSGGTLDQLFVTTLWTSPRRNNLTHLHLQWIIITQPKITGARYKNATPCQK
jgi:hypothetical protein